VSPLRLKAVPRSHLIERLNAGLHGKLTLTSAPAGFGKSTLISEWIAGCGRPVAWLSLDEEDKDPSRFMTYYIAALQTIDAVHLQDLRDSVFENNLSTSSSYISVSDALKTVDFQHLQSI
jgi:ATP/maltotriose-dependent transcriptional regulator MalT